MSSLLEMLGQNLDPAMIQQISSAIGADSGTTQSAVASALPALFGGMAQHATTGTGASQIHQAVQSAPADGSNPAPAPSLVSSILGPHEQEVQNNVAQASGLNFDQAKKLLTYLAPIAVSLLSRKTAENPQATQQPGGLAGILRTAEQATQSSSAGGGLSGLLGSMLG